MDQKYSPKVIRMDLHQMTFGVAKTLYLNRQLPLFIPDLSKRLHHNRREKADFV